MTQPRTLRFRTGLVGASLLCVSLLASVGTLHAQQPGTPATVSGVVVDQSSGDPIRGAFLSVGERGPRAITDSTGAFRLPAVASGDQLILVRSFGYLDLSLNVFVEAAAGPLRVVLQPEPIALEGVSAMGRAEVALSGKVTSAEDGSPLPWVSLTLSPDAVRTEGASSSDPDGIFRIDDVSTGRYFLRAQALGYKSQYVMVDVSAPPEVVQVALEPDPVIQAGIARFNGRLKERRNYLPGINRAYDQERLHYTAATSATRFLATDAGLPLIDCAGNRNAIGNLCILNRGMNAEPAVYIDELPMMAGLEVLDSYHPSELYSIEVFNNGTAIHAYTYKFMERMAVKPRGFIIPQIQLRGETRAPGPRGGTPD